MVTSKAHVRELGQAPPSQLSLHAVAKEVSSSPGIRWQGLTGETKGVQMALSSSGLYEVSAPSIYPRYCPM
ncbi:MAG: hypothetical protein Q9196_002422 [Gyalolechia fulgens]